MNLLKSYQHCKLCKKDIKMASVNKVVLLGNCGRDPEVRYLPSGKAIANISLATSSKRKDKNTGEMVEETQWHRVLFFERLAELAGEYLKKGNPVYVEGRLRYGKYTDKDGVERNTTDIVATEMQLLGSRQAGSGGTPTPSSASRSASGSAPTASTSAGTGTGTNGSSGGFDDMDDDIPF